MSSEKQERGPRLPYGKLSGVWTELSRTYRGQKDGTIQPEDAKARVYTLSAMIGVADRLIEERALATMKDEIATWRATMNNGASPPARLTTGLRDANA